MVGKTNVGGGTKLFAAIGVTYPAGSTLTCSNGTSTLKAKTTTGQWVFAIPSAGTWTVTATLGTSTKSQSVSITTEGQFESVVLAYRQYLFESGVGASVDFEAPECTMDSRLADCLRFYGTQFISFNTTEKISLKSGQTIVLEFSTGSLDNIDYSYTLTVANKKGGWGDFNNGDPTASAGVAQAKAIPSAVGVRTTIRLPIDFSGDFYIGGGCYYASGAAVDKGLAVYNLYIE